VDAVHGGSTGLSQDLDTTFQAAGFWPDMVLSGHAHLYQRFTQRVNNNTQQLPYVICGCGGFAVSPPQTNVGPAPITVGNDTMEIDPIMKFGYLTITCDGSTLTSAFYSPSGGGGAVAVLDTVSVNLKTGLLSTTSPKPAHGKHKPVHGKTKAKAASTRPVRKKTRATSPRKARNQMVKKRRK
jgi:hypothetical protein